MCWGCSSRGLCPRFVYLPIGVSYMGNIESEDRPVGLQAEPNGHQRVQIPPTVKSSRPRKILM